MTELIDKNNLSPPSVIICDVKPQMEAGWNCKTEGFDHPHFDLTNARDNTTLTNLVGGISGVDEVERTFSEAEEKLQKIYPVCLYIPLYKNIATVAIFLYFLFYVLIFAFVTPVRMTCLTNNVCNTKDNTDGCCFVECCNSQLYPDECIPSTTSYFPHEQNVKAGISMDPKCCLKNNENYFKCGKIKLSGDHSVMPGKGLLYWWLAVVLYVNFAISLWTWIGLTYRKIAKTTQILEDNFEHWKYKGIEIKYTHPTIIPCHYSSGFVQFIITSAPEEPVSNPGNTSFMRFKFFTEKVSFIPKGGICNCPKWSVFAINFVIFTVFPFYFLLIAPMWEAHTSQY
jgi:hypothetical protein